jgi:hypothetical protein
MIWAIAAISVSEQIEKYGAYAGLAAVVGLGVLSLLYFAQAREVKRLREWAGRAPERAAELEARVAADAARRASGAPLRAQTPAGQAAAAGTATPSPAAAPAAAPAGAQAAAGALQAAGGAQAAPGEGETKQAEPVKAPVPGLPIPVPAASGASAAPSAGSAASTSAPSESQSEPAKPDEQSPQPTASPAGNGIASTPPTTVGPRVPGRPPPGASTTPPPAAPATAAAAARPLRDAPPSRTLPPRDEPVDDGHHSPSRRTLGVIGGALLVVAAVVVVLVLTLGGEDTPPPPNQVAETAGRTTDVEPARTQSSRQARIDRADTPVVVLNGTGVNGLARQVADRLQSTGYQAAVDNTQSRQATIIGYKTGAEAAAREIGKLLEVPSGQIQPMPSELTGVAGNNAVVVVIGADKATD